MLLDFGELRLSIDKVQTSDKVTQVSEKVTIVTQKSDGLADYSLEHSKKDNIHTEATPVVIERNLSVTQVIRRSQ